MAERPLRVALVNHSAQLGGAELALLRLASHFDPERIRATVFLGEDGPLVDRLRATSVDAAICPLDRRLLDCRKDSLTGSGLASPADLVPLVGAVWELAGELRRCGARVVHTNSLKAHVVGGLAGRLAGARVLWHVRDHIASPYLPPAAVRAMRLAARIVPHRVLAVSGSAARTAGRRDVQILHQGGVEIPSLDAIGRGRKGCLRVGLVGRIAPWKGQDIFLAAAARLAPRFPQAEFVLAGAPLFGEEEHERRLRRQAELDGLAGRVRFLGFCDDVWDVYRGLDVAVHASTLPEPFGNVVVEAMASGTPIVAADAGGVPEIVENGRTGLLVRPGDPGALAGALEQLLADPAERSRLALAGREDIERRFSLERDAEAVQRIYEELAAGERALHARAS